MEIKAPVMENMPKRQEGVCPVCGESFKKVYLQPGLDVGKIYDKQECQALGSALRRVDRYLDSHGLSFEELQKRIL